MKRQDNILVLDENELKALAKYNIPVSNEYFLIGIDKPTRDIILTPYHKAPEFIIHISQASQHAAKLQLTLEAPVQAKVKPIEDGFGVELTAELDITGIFNMSLRMPTKYKLREVYTDHIFMNGRLVAPHIIFSPVNDEVASVYTRKD